MSSWPMTLRLMSDTTLPALCSKGSSETKGCGLSPVDHTTRPAGKKEPSANLIPVSVTSTGLTEVTRRMPSCRNLLMT
jgi:hypothetical protein